MTGDGRRIVYLAGLRSLQITSYLINLNYTRSRPAGRPGGQAPRAGCGFRRPALSCRTVYISESALGSTASACIVRGVDVTGRHLSRQTGESLTRIAESSERRGRSRPQC